MPATSAAQWRLMKGIAEGSIPPKGTLTKAKAQEFISSQRTPEGLPEKHKASGIRGRARGRRKAKWA